MIRARAAGVRDVRGARPQILCAACGSRFEADGARAGEEVRCPLCSEAVRLGRLVTLRRRVRAELGTAEARLGLPGAKRVPRRDALRVALRFSALAALVAVGGAVWYWWDDVAPAVASLSR